MDTARSMLCAFCAAFALVTYGQSAQQPETGYDLAPSLEGIKRANPEMHRVLADGTFDSMTPTEQMRFSNRIGSTGLDEPSTEQLQEETIETVETLLRTLPPSERGRFEGLIKRTALEKIKIRDRTMRLKAQGPTAMPEIRQLQRELEDRIKDKGRIYGLPAEHEDIRNNDLRSSFNHHGSQIDQRFAGTSRGAGDSPSRLGQSGGPASAAICHWIYLNCVILSNRILADDEKQALQAYDGRMQRADEDYRLCIIKYSQSVCESLRLQAYDRAFDKLEEDLDAALVRAAFRELGCLTALSLCCLPVFPSCWF